jgi:hypothetical protein
MGLGCDRKEFINVVLETEQKDLFVAEQDLVGPSLNGMARPQVADGETLCFENLMQNFIFKPTISNKSLHQDSNDSGVRIIISATSRNLFV